MTQTELLSKEEIALIIDEAERTDEFDYMLFLTLKTTGRRIGELYGVEEITEIGKKMVGKKIIYINGERTEVDKTAPIYKKSGHWIYGVKVKDIDLEKGTMKVYVLKRRQYIQDETILLPEVVRVISQYIKKNRLNLDDYVFRKKKRTMRQIQNRIKMYARKTGINKRVTIHNFRHYFITELKRRGWSDDKIIKLTGHRSAQVLRIYDHIVATDLREEAMESIRDL